MERFGACGDSLTTFGEYKGRQPETHSAISKNLNPPCRIAQDLRASAGSCLLTAFAPPPPNFTPGDCVRRV